MLPTFPAKGFEAPCKQGCPRKSLGLVLNKDVGQGDKQASRGTFKHLLLNGEESILVAAKGSAMPASKFLKEVTFGKITKKSISENQKYWIISLQAVYVKQHCMDKTIIRLELNPAHIHRLYHQ